MSSPIHHAEDLDSSLKYAPPWAQRRNLPISVTSFDQSPTWPADRRRVERSGFSGDRAMQELQRQFALNPDKVPEPPFVEARSLWPLALRTCAVLGVAAIVAGAVVFLPNARKPASKTAPADTALADNVTNRVKLVPIHVDAPAPPQAAASPPEANDGSVRIATLQPELPQNSPALAGESQQSPPTYPLENESSQAVQPVENTPALDADEIAILIERGQDLLKNGDLASARLLLRRAAEAGSADAAFEFGTTFDPIVIQKLGVIGIQPDMARARKWYEKAAALGSAAASEQIARLNRAR